MSFWSRLFMDPYQRSLRNPEDYHRVLDHTQIIAELKSGKAGRDPESIGMMIDAADPERFVDPKPLTIARVVEQQRSMRRALEHEGDRGLREFGTHALCGSSLLGSYLIRRANALAESTKPGAEQLLAQAFEP